MDTSKALALGFALAAAGAVAQQGSPPATGGLTLEGRTPEERVRFLVEVGQAYFRENDFESAVDAYERVIEIDPRNLEARYVLGHVYISAKQYGKAEATLLDMVSDFPEDFKLLNNLGWLYATAEDPAIRDGAKALDYAQRAMVLAPTDHHVWSTLSEAYYVTGDYEKAYRAITHMAALAARFGTNITKEMVDNYNEQIRKCKRAMDLEQALGGAQKDG